MSTTTAHPQSPLSTAESTADGRIGIYLLLGIVFGIVLIKAEVVSWFRIQEMFRFQSFHMYGVIGSAWATSALLLQVIKRRQMRDLAGNPIVVPPKRWAAGSRTRYWLGGLLFGFGWALTGACPGPQFALIGAGVTPIILTLASAVAGAWVYGLLRPNLPH